VREKRSADNMSVVALTRWWQGNPAAIVDITNKQAADWWFERLENIRQDVGVDAFKFDAGEPCWLPTAYTLSESSEDAWPGRYTTDFAKRTLTFGGSRSEVRVGLRSQQSVGLVRMLDKDSSWGYANGLRTLIPCALQMSLSGYPFVLPDMIGGNGYGDGANQHDNHHSSIRPSSELFVRWMQAAILMPAVQFSFVPWEYSQEVTDYTRQLVLLRLKMFNIILESAKEACKSGSPIIKPGSTTSL
jgi:alpha-glucosidase (family GH31 glycosyl hydrolase)